MIANDESPSRSNAPPPPPPPPESFPAAGPDGGAARPTSFICSLAGAPLPVQLSVNVTVSSCATVIFTSPSVGTVPLNDGWPEAVQFVASATVHVTL